MKYVIAILMISGLAAAHECNPAKPKDPCAKKPVVRRIPAAHPVVQKPVNDNDNENEQEQKQRQTVNVYNTAPQQVQERRVVIERSVLHHRYNNRLGFLLGVGPRDCCNGVDSNRGLVGGAYYERRITGPFSLGVQALTNKTYLGMVGIDF